jgi:ATP-binding cassette subfamily B multidrug efflux pump
MPYVARYKGMTILGLLTLALMGIVGSLPPLIIGIIFDCLGKSPQALSNLQGTARSLLHPLFLLYHPFSARAVMFYCGLLVLAMLVKGVFSYWTRWILIGVSRDIEYDLRNDLLASLLKLEPQFYVRNPTGELMSRCTNDLNAVRMVLGPGIMYTATTITTMVLAAYFMIKLSPMLTLWVLLPVPLVAISVRYFGQIIHRLSEKIQAALATLSAKAQENLAGVRLIRAYAQEDAEIRLFDAPNREYVSRNIQLIRSWSMFFPALRALIGATFVIVLWEGGRMAMQGRMSVGTLFAIYTYMVQLVWPMVALGWVTNIFQRGAASMGRLNYLLDAKPRIGDESIELLPIHWNDSAEEKRARAASGNGTGAHGAHRHEAEIQGDIEFRNLTFSYPTAAEGTAPALQNINLEIPAGSTLGVVGHTGSGKSTLVSLIARLWEAPKSTLELDGRSIQDWPLAELRHAIGYVSQDPFLFSETIRGNIALGVPDATQEAVSESAEIASLREEIELFPKGFDTLLGERGITLSGGQKQRTALARAILRNPKILILDDSLSSVDTDTEDRILSKLKQVMRRRTTIVISHRISTLRHADQIIVLRRGQIVERGTHEELLAAGAEYADLHQKQLLEEELERA